MKTKRYYSVYEDMELLSEASSILDGVQASLRQQEKALWTIEGASDDESPYAVELLMRIAESELRTQASCLLKAAADIRFVRERNKRDVTNPASNT